VGAYGYARKVTPHFDALAKVGTVFERAYCPTPHTSYSVTSLLTGKYMRPLLLQSAGEDSDTWAGLLRTSAIAPRRSFRRPSSSSIRIAFRASRSGRSISSTAG
jgi:hypothetical protein